MQENTLYYIHDPMCSWCYAFAPAWLTIRQHLPAHIHIQRLLGGLASDTDESMPEEMRAYLQATWRRIEQRVPGIYFNYDFWARCEPRRATYPACRAIIAAREQGAQYDEQMTRAIQHAYYQRARNPSDPDTLIDLAAGMGLDIPRFTAHLNSTETQHQLEDEITLSRKLGSSSLPSLVLNTGGSHWPIPVEYSQPQNSLALIRQLLD